MELPPTGKRLVPPAAEKVDSLAHLLFSASAWEILKDYGGLTGTQARETASWVLEVILSAITSGHSPADVKSQMKDTQWHTFVGEANKDQARLDLQPAAGIH